MHHCVFKYDTNPDWYITPERREALEVVGIKVPPGQTVERDGSVTMFDHPFGMHLTVSFADGEHIHTVMTTGGHKAHGLVVVQICDSPLDVRYFDGSKEAYDAFIASFIHKEGERSIRVAVEEAIKLLWEDVRQEWEARRERLLEEKATTKEAASG